MEKLHRCVELRHHPDHQNSHDGQYRSNLRALFAIWKMKFHDECHKGPLLDTGNADSDDLRHISADSGI
jgi:hypothetical protein